MMPDSKFIEKVKPFIGFTWVSSAIEIEKGMIKKFVEAIGDDNLLWKDDQYAKMNGYSGIIAPPTFLQAINIGEMTQQGIPIDIPLERELSAGDNITCYLLVSPGDVIIPTNKIIDIYQKSGKTVERMVFIIIETTYVNQRGETVAKGCNTHIKF